MSTALIFAMTPVVKLPPLFITNHEFLFRHYITALSVINCHEADRFSLKRFQALGVVVGGGVVLPTGMIHDPSSCFPPRHVKLGAFSGLATIYSKS